MTEIYDFDIEIENDGHSVSLSGTLSGRAHIDREDGVSYVHRMEHLHFFGRLGVRLDNNTDALRLIPIDTEDEGFIDWVIDEFVGWDWVDDEIVEGQTHG